MLLKDNDKILSIPKENETSFFLRPTSIFMRVTGCLGFIASYLFIKFVLISYLPGKWFVDSEKMFSQAGSDKGGSFAASARLLGLLPSWAQEFLVMSIAITCIILVFKTIKTRRGLIFSPIILMPFLMLNVLVPSKETIVLLLSLSVFFASRHIKPIPLFLGFIALLYLLYGAQIRSYFLLIAAAWLCLVSMKYMNKGVIVFFAAVFFIGLFFIPGEIFHKLQGSRDFGAKLTEVYGITAIRTYFTNPFEPVSALAFIGNYIYAFCILHFPFFNFFGIKEILLFLNVLIYGAIIRSGLQCVDMKTQIMTKLFIAHLVVLWIFEPDLGSYYRHFSSVFPLLLAAFKVFESNALSEKPETMPLIKKL